MGLQKKTYIGIEPNGGRTAVRIFPEQKSWLNLLIASSVEAQNKRTEWMIWRQSVGNRGTEGDGK